MPDAFDFTKTYVHLGLGPTATPVPDFEWSQEFLERYAADTEADGDEGRLACLIRQESTWDSWERHPAGEELVAQLTGKSVLTRETDGREERVELDASMATVNPKGVWHTADVLEPGWVLFVTPGRGTEHRPR